ncbi:MAG TPA: ImcF-related family protein, partial [Ramlibacter sp.]|nr:ImcF-related family protein [Ramlibacter sp.]
IVFSRLPLADRVMSRLRPLADNARNAPPWRASEALGPAGSRFFVRASGQPLPDAAVPGLFTVEGLHRIVLPALPQAVREAVAESWVLGPQAVSVAGAGDPVQLEVAVLTLYANEYAAAWDAVLNDLNIRPLSRAPAEAAEALLLLGAPNSPIRDVLRSIARQLSPGTNPDAPAQGQGQPGQPAGGAQRQRDAAGGPEPSSAEPVARIIEQRYQALRAVPGQPLDGALQIVNDLYAQVVRLVGATPGLALPPTPGLSPIQRLQAEAARQPDPFGRWLRILAVGSAGTTEAGSRQQIAAAGAAEVAPRCRPMEARFPIRRDGPEPPVDDFQRLFGPGGTLDQFFSTRLRQFVDTTQTPWRPVAPETQGGRPIVSPEDATQFWRASVIRDAFFPGVGAGGLRFELVPQGFDAGAQGAILEAEGVRTEIGRGGPFRPISLSWPSRTNSTLTFDPPASVGPLAFDGPWSSLRLVMRRENTLVRVPNQPDRATVTIRAGDRFAQFQLRAGSSNHPFGLRELEEFRCPQLAP